MMELALRLAFHNHFPVFNLNQHFGVVLLFNHASGPSDFDAAVLDLHLDTVRQGDGLAADLDTV